MTSDAVFNKLADRYDAWFDTAEGSALFAAEVDCIRSLLPADLSGWIEVGVGTGRFAAALDIREGVDVSPTMLEKAARRGVRTTKAAAENLPYPSNSLEGVLLVVTLCFLEDPEKAMHELARTIKTGGRLLVGIVPADSPWGRHYRAKSEQGHPFYSVANFYTCRQAKHLAASAGFRFVGAASTLLMEPGGDPGNVPVLKGIVEGCGFVAMLLRTDPD